MVSVLEAMVETVYGAQHMPYMGGSFRDNCSMSPLYFFPLGRKFPVPMDERQARLIRRREYFIPVLTKALRQALTVSDRLRGKRAYERDLVAIGRSALDALFNREALGSDFIIVTPGIRPAWAAKNDQRRVATPEVAVANGADFIVVGRPITKAESPAGAARMILDEMAPAEVPQ